MAISAAAPTQVSPSALNRLGTDQAFQWTGFQDGEGTFLSPWYVQISNFSGRPIGTVIKMAINKNSSTDAGSYRQKHKILHGARDSATALTQCRQIDIIFDGRLNSELIFKDLSEGDLTPLLKNWGRKHGPLLDIGDSRDANSQGQ